MNYPDDNYPGGHGDEEDPKENDNNCSHCGGRLELVDGEGFEGELVCNSCDKL